MGFSNVFNHSLDPKNRVFIPAEFREELGENFYLFKSPDDCILIYTQKRWEELSSRFDNVETKEDRLRKRAYFSRVCSCKMDKQGRITIGAEFLEFANITKDVIFEGMGNCIELWDAEAYRKNLSSSEMDNIDLSNGVFL